MVMVVVMMMMVASTCVNPAMARHIFTVSIALLKKSKKIQS